MHLPKLSPAAGSTLSLHLHPTAGGPEDWMVGSTVSFDFFVDWEHETVANEIWVKLLLDAGETLAGGEAASELEAMIRPAYPDYGRLLRFADQAGFQVHFMAIDDSQDWSQKKAGIVEIVQEANGLACRPVPLTELRERIAECSGAHFRIGKKGLKLCTTELEGWLAANTDTLWPGDADGVVLNKGTDEPLALLEYRKHTKGSRLTDVTQYYESGADKKKYDRLDILARRMNVPLVVLTYPTVETIKTVKLDLVKIEEGSMKIPHSAICPIPEGPGDGLSVKKELNRLLQKWKPA